MNKDKFNEYQKLYVNLDTKYRLQDIFEESCKKNNLDDVKLLVENKFINNIEKYSRGIYCACEYGNIQIIDFLLTYFDYHSSIGKLTLNHVYTECFKISKNFHQPHVIEYFIFQHQIPTKSLPFSELEVFLYANPYVHQLFEKRDLLNKLNQNLKEPSNQSIVKSKI